MWLGGPVRKIGLSYWPASLGIDYWALQMVYKYGLRGEGGGGEPGTGVGKWHEIFHDQGYIDKWLCREMNTLKVGRLPKYKMGDLSTGVANTL
jgi:hypothetical protein